METKVFDNVLFADHLQKLDDNYEIIKFKENAIKDVFAYNNKNLEYTVIASSKYGLRLILNFYNINDISEQEQFLEVYENFEFFKKQAKEEKSKFKNHNKLDLEVFCYFPNLEKSYFDAGFLDDEFSQLVKEINNITDGNIITKLTNINSIKVLFDNYEYKSSNEILKEESNLISIWSLFTLDTVIDNNSPLLYEKSDKEVEGMLARFELDKEQINAVERYNTENRLILAEAGTGKSVILFSKAQRLATLNPDKRFLILTFNKFLSDEYKNKIKYENFKRGKIDVYTFNGFVNKLTNTQHAYDVDLSVVIKDIDQSEIKEYDGIYIDEVQLFKPDWLELCYQTLNSINAGEYTLVLAGDINQSSNTSTFYPWRKTSIPSFKGRSIKLNKVYRATESINNFTKDFIRNIYTLYERLEVEYDSSIYDEASYDVKPWEDGRLRNLTLNDYDDVVFFNTSYNKKVEVPNRMEEISLKIKALEEKNIDIRELVVLFSTRLKYGVEYIKVLEEELDKQNISYVSTDESINKDNENSNDNNDRVRYQNIKERLAIVSAQKCTGLDFNQVIVIGLDTLVNHTDYKTKNIEDISIDIDEELLKERISLMYIQLTRARKKLYIEIPAWFTYSFSVNNPFRLLLLGD